MKRKLTKAKLSELELHAEIMNLFEQKRIVGGGSGSSYSMEEYLRMVASGNWSGGNVDGLGYVGAGDSVNWSSGSDPGYGGTDSGSGYGSNYDYGYSSGSGYGSGYESSGYGYGSSYVSGTDINIDGYNIRINSGSISDYSANILKQVMMACNDRSITITSTARSVEDQARVMYENILKTGVGYQRRIYKVAGQAVIDVYDPKLDRTQNISNMAKKIRELGPSKVSHHCADQNTLNVFDVSKGTVTNLALFKSSLEARGYKVLDENGCFHIEIPQTNK